MTTDLNGLKRDELLGYPAYFRVILEKGALAFGDLMFSGGIDDAYNALPSTGLVEAVNPNPQVKGDEVVTIDLRVLPEAANTTVTELLQALEDLDWRVHVRSIQRVTEDLVLGQEGINSRDATTAAEQQQVDSESFGTELSNLGSDLGAGLSHTVKVIAIAAVLVVIVYAWLRSKGGLQSWT